MGRVESDEGSAVVCPVTTMAGRADCGSVAAWDTGAKPGDIKGVERGAVGLGTLGGAKFGVERALGRGVKPVVVAKK